MQKPTVQELTTEILKNLENKGLIINLESEKDFLSFLNLKFAILYILVEWSGTERMSRQFVYKVLNEMNQEFYVIDCSEQNQKYVETWLSEQKLNTKDFHYGGNGETLFVNSGSIVEFIKYPLAIGTEKLELKFKEWQSRMT